jgi:hypothetical protein
MLESIVTNPEPRITLFDDAPDPSVRADRAHQAFRERYDILQEQLRSAGLPIDGSSAISAVLMSGLRLAEVWAARAKQLERTLRMILASDFISDSQRADVAAVLFGKKKVGRDSHALNEYEHQLIQHYRTADGAGKQMLRTMASLAATASERQKGGA